MIDKRGYPRHRVFKEAKMDCGRHGHFSCQVTDLSEKGARIRLATITALPQEINLEIASARSLCSARVCWQIGQEAGVKFTGPARFRDCVAPVNAPGAW